MRRLALLALLLLPAPAPALAEGVLGYYRDPALRGETVVFAAEGDLWTVGVTGGLARRLTTHPGEETSPTISPDGETLAFSATYEGPTEVYTMPVSGGLPTRRTWEAEWSVATAWTPDGRLLYATSHYSGVRDLQLVALDIESSARARIPLSEASEGGYDAAGETLFFVRPSFHFNVTKRYRGGTARRIWAFGQDDAEATVLTDDYVGESHTPMWWSERVYFISDRDGTMNLWSMNEDGSDPTQLTEHSGWDVRDASLSAGRVVYQVGADLWLYEIGSGVSRMIEITLATDVDQWREKWVREPMDYLSSARIHPEGESVILTARGRLFVAPADQGRLVRPSRAEGVRYRDAVFMPEGESLLALSDESGELEFVKIPADGIGDQEPLTDDGEILRFEGVPSPDGKFVAYTDQNLDLWLLEIESRQQTRLSTRRESVSDIAWSPDSRWVTFSEASANTYSQLALYSLDSKNLVFLTSDRTNSWSSAWDPKGEWLYFLSDRELDSLVRSPWGARQPEPYFDRPMKIYQLALQKGSRSPFRPADELMASAKDEESEGDDEADADTAEPSPVEIDLAGIQGRIHEVPAPPGNYRGLSVNETALFFMTTDSGPDPESHLSALEISRESPKLETLVKDARFYDLSRDGKKILVRKNDALYVIGAGTDAPSDLGENRVDLSKWSFSIDPRQDWRQIFVDAWRLERDYFYDPGMHGLDWDAIRDKYLPLVDRVTTRAELSELIGRAVGELSALHTSVRGGDHRDGPDDVDVAGLGARLVRDAAQGGYRIDYIYRSDPDYPHERSPLADPSLGVSNGDVITMINGSDILEAPDPAALLRNQAGRQVRLRLVSGESGETRDEIVVPVARERDLRYRDWQYTRRLEVEEKTESQVGYVHLRAMGGSNLTEWYRHFYPVFNRPGLIIDVRNNNGGNIDSIILEKLLRRAWFYWRGRVGTPYWNMQYAFRGHVVVLCNQQTASDGEAFAEGIRRLDIGKVIGKRTWGGEIWLSSTNRLSDRGIARAPMWGVYGDEGEWLIEQHGVEPDIEVDNLPHETFNGRDAQLETAIDYLLREIELDPRGIPEPPAYPDLSFDYPERP